MDAVVVLITWLIGLFVAYWVIRLAVRHGIRDADDRRAIAAARLEDAATPEH
ncbi:hypothetical protein [Georgenia thermotolerans]|uniref:hypothetical protein n=1 Tax=Georgenia thermotolerans TaxID=527326 RepID=UPI001478B4CA|nr:hypothetical protein [Georgenia thermotolerans]